MYFWKCWRDTRRGVLVYVGLLLLFAIFWAVKMSDATRIRHISDAPSDIWAMDLAVTFVLTYLCALVMGFSLGTSSAGADIGNGTGDFLLTRPRSRRYFIWMGWLAGIVELLALITLTGLLTFGCVTFASGPVWRQLPASGHFHYGESGISNLPITLAMVLLTAAVVFGLTYFCTVLFRSGQRGLISSLAALFGYSFGNSLLERWGGISLPSLNFNHASLGPDSPWQQALLLHILGWSVFALAFPLVAQVIFERRDI